MAKTISRDTPLAEITLRKYEKPSGLEPRELVRKLCLSLGLLQPGDSRDVVVDVFLVFLKNFKESKGFTSTEIEKLTVQNRKKYELPLFGIAPSNIRRQILRLRDSFLIEKVGNYYRINEGTKLIELFEEKLEAYYLNSIISRVKDYVEEVDSIFLTKEDSAEEED